jgi:hypothetical protein
MKAWLTCPYLSQLIGRISNELVLVSHAYLNSVQLF